MPKKKKKNKPNKLTPKQLAFCREYIKDHNGTQAAIRAGYSKKTANEQASQNLAKLNIQAKIKEAQEKAWDAAIMGRAEILARLSDMGRSNMADYVTPGGELNISKILEEKPVLSEFRVEEYQGERSSGIKRKCKLESPKDALKELAKLQGLHAPERLEITVTPEEEVLQAEFEKRIAGMSTEELLKQIENLEVVK